MQERYLNCNSCVVFMMEPGGEQRSFLTVIKPGGEKSYFPGGKASVGDLSFMMLDYSELWGKTSISEISKEDFEKLRWGKNDSTDFNEKDPTQRQYFIRWTRELKMMASKQEFEEILEKFARRVALREIEEEAGLKIVERQLFSRYYCTEKPGNHSFYVFVYNEYLERSRLMKEGLEGEEKLEFRIMGEEELIGGVNKLNLNHLDAFKSEEIQGLLEKIELRNKT